MCVCVCLCVCVCVCARVRESSIREKKREAGVRGAVGDTESVKWHSVARMVCHDE